MCTNDIGLPIFDATVGLLAVAFTAYIYSSLREDKNARDSAGKIAAPILSLSALGFGSSVYGFKMVSNCNRVKKLERDELKVMGQQRRHRKEAWGRAWGITQRAALTARTGDCVTVIKLSAVVNALDEEFHAAVFARDVAIARCLASNATPIPASETTLPPPETTPPPPATTPPIDLRPKLTPDDVPTEKRPPGTP